MCCKDKKVIDYVEKRTNTVNIKDFKDGDIIKLKNGKIEKILHIRYYPTAPYPYEVTFESNKWKSETYLCNGGISLVSESPMDIIGKEKPLLLNTSPDSNIELVTINQIKPLQLNSKVMTDPNTNKHIIKTNQKENKMKKLLIILTTLTLIGCEYDPDRYYLVMTSFGNKFVRSEPLHKDECLLEKTNEDARLKIENDTTSSYDCILIK